jgi:hypothetical protein
VEFRIDTNQQRAAAASIGAAALLSCLKRHDDQKLLNFMAYRQKVARSDMAGKTELEWSTTGHPEGDTFGCAWEDCGDEH